MLSQLKAMLPPGVKSAINRLRGFPTPVSADYKRINDSAEIDGLKDAWQDPTLPEAQRKNVDTQIAAMRAGNSPRVFLALAEAVRETGSSQGNIVEVGCSSGYYYEVLTFLLDHPIDYIGIDYSQPFVELARRYYPEVIFEVADAAALPLADESCDILISGGVLLHVPDYKKAIAESVRVSRDWVIFHRTPIISGGITLAYEKKAYGVRCLELSFSEAELLAEFSQAGLKVVKEFLIEGTESANADQESQKTYLCRRAERKLNDQRAL